MKKYKIWILFFIINIITLSSDQYIYSQIHKENLIVSNQYIVEGFDLENNDSVSALEVGDINLKTLLTSTTSYLETKFENIENERYGYSGDPRSMVKFNLTKNAEAPKNARFTLTEVEESGESVVYKRLINENYYIPGAIKDLKEENFESSKNTFIYHDENKFKHLIEYKYQEVVFRIYTGDKKEELIPIKEIQVGQNLDNFYNGGYVDFVFENNGTAQTIEKNGVIGKFIEGKFEIIGLERDKDYNLDFYTLRYRGDSNTGNYVVVTFESSLSFSGKNIGTIQGNSGWLKNIDISNYKNIGLNIITMTNDDLSQIELKNIKEKRDNIEKNINDITISSPTSLSGQSINIDGTNYEVVDNQIKMPEKKYVYKWIGNYNTEFSEEEGKERTISFDIEGVANTVPQTGIYLEPVAVEKDLRYPHQRILFNSNYNLKNKNYKVIDRILTPAKYGYRQIKSLDYQSDLEGYLEGENYTDKNNFTFINNNWEYTVDESVEGIIIEKTISDAKGELVDEDGIKIDFYTDNIGSGIDKLEEDGDKVVYNWNESTNNSNGVILNYDKVMFRLAKVPESGVVTENVNYLVGEENEQIELPIYYWNPYEQKNPINYIDENQSSLKMEAFLFGNTNGNYETNYIDLIFDISVDREMTFSNAVISYESTNNNLRIIGLPVGEYLVEFYSIKRGHNGSYKVVSYEDYDEFTMDIPEIASEEFDKENNVYKIDFITTSTNNNNIQVNVNFITKMEREINLTADNLESVNLPGFKLSEKNEGTSEVEGIGESNEITLKESEQRRFLFPLDVVFVIDNSGSMQNEIDAVKDGLSDFGQELYNRGFDVKYNLITFGPAQTSSTIGAWSLKVDEYLDKKRSKYYMAIYKDKWFDGATLSDVTIENIREKEKDELIDAFSNIRASSGYYKGQENSAWGIHYAIEKLRENGRYLDYSGEITDDSSSGYMPSQKLIIFLTDENMDTDNLPSGYNSLNVLEKLYAQLNSTYNGLADNINLTGIFHVKRNGNKTNEDVSTDLKFYEEVPKLKYLYTNGLKNYTRNWVEYDDSNNPIKGIIPSDKKEKYHSDFKLYNTGNNFFMYEMGSSGEHVSGALQETISNIGIIQRWELSYLTPFDKYDGTTRTVDFKLINIKGSDGTPISREIKDLDKYEDKQYKVQEEKLVVEFRDPTGTSPKLSVVGGKGVITFLAKSRYHEENNQGEAIIIEDVIKDRSLNVLKTDGTLLFSRRTDDIGMRLSDEGWLPLVIAKDSLESILENRKSSWVSVKNLPIDGNPVKDVLSYIDKARYRVDGSNNYEMWLKKSEVDSLVGADLGDAPNEPYFNLVIDGSKTRVAEPYFKDLMGDRSDTWYELRNDSTNSDSLSGINSPDFEKLDDKRYRIRLSDRELKKVINSESGEGVELKISRAKLEALDGNFDNFEDFGEQGWYEFNITLTDTEMEILREAKLDGKPIEYINLEATAVTDLFSETKVLLDVMVDITPPKIVEVTVIDQTLRKFLKSMKTLDGNLLLTNSKAEKYSGYTATTSEELKDLLSKAGAYVKVGDIIDLEIVLEDRNLTEDDIYIGVNELGWKMPNITSESDGVNGEKRFRLSWVGIEITNEIDSVKITNRVEDKYGNVGNQDISILNTDMTDINPAKTLRNSSGEEITMHPSDDNKYYVNDKYNIAVGDIGNMYRAGIVVFEYDKEKSDSKDGEPSYHSTPDEYYIGSTIGEEMEVGIDTVSHKFDGEYTGKIYGMSKSGKLIDISDYSEKDLDKIVDLNYQNSPLEKVTIMVDTVAPTISNVSIINKTFMDKYGVNSVDTNGITHVKNGDIVEVKFDIKDFNMYVKEKVETVKGGYLLELLNGYSGITELSNSASVSSDSTVEDTHTISYELKVEDVSDAEKEINIELSGEDKAGNESSITKKIMLSNIAPKGVTLKIYEEVKGWSNATTDKKGEPNVTVDGYKFTKGGETSLVNDPKVFASISGEGSEIRYLKIEKNYSSLDPLLDIQGQTSEIVIDGSNGGLKFNVDHANEVKVTPISVSGVEGTATTFKFVVDTRVNTSYLGGGVIGNLIDGKIKVDLSSLEELVGIEGYKAKTVIREKEIGSEEKENLGGNSFTTIQSGSINNVITIDVSEHKGSQVNLILTVWDKLGHEKIFTKTYFIPAETSGIKSTIENEVRQRKSKLKIIGDGVNDKFEVESSVDASEEDTD